MRIGIIAPPWLSIPPTAYGGTEMIIDVLARGFVEAGHEVLLCCSGDSTCPVPRYSAVNTSEGVKMGTLYVELQHVIKSYERLQDYDIIYDHTLTGLVYSERFPHLNVVTMCHNEFNPPMLDIYRQVMHRVPIISISNRQASLSQDVPVAKVIHHGIDAQDIAVGDGSGDYFIYLGRMAPWKGAARAALIAKEAGCKLVMAAKMHEVPEHRYFEQEVEPLLDDNISFVGEVGYDEKFRLLAGARGLINPIRWNEPFGLAMIEALACGTPVITYPEGAAPEIVEDGVTGFLCADEAGMVDAIHRIDEIDRSACRSAVDNHFSAKRNIEEHLQFFTEFLGRQPRREVMPAE